MSATTATPNDVVRLLLDCFKELHGEPASYQDVEEAQRLASLPLTPEAITSRMREVAQRNGVNWKPSSLRYFARPIGDLLAPKPALTVVASTPTATSDRLTLEQHDAWLEHLRSLESPEQLRRADRVTHETKGLPMITRVRIATSMLRDATRLTRQAWDVQFEAVVTRALPARG